LGALKVRTKASLPDSWAVTQTNRAGVLAEIGRIEREPSLLRQAETLLGQALETFRKEGDANNADIVSGQLERLRSELSAWSA
jgi:hypothetical protein